MSGRRSRLDSLRRPPIEFIPLEERKPDVFLDALKNAIKQGQRVFPRIWSASVSGGQYDDHIETALGFFDELLDDDNGLRHAAYATFFAAIQRCFEEVGVSTMADKHSFLFVAARAQEALTRALLLCSRERRLVLFERIHPFFSPDNPQGTQEEIRGWWQKHFAGAMTVVRVIFSFRKKAPVGTKIWFPQTIHDMYNSTDLLVTWPSGHKSRGLWIQIKGSNKHSWVEAIVLDRNVRPRTTPGNLISRTWEGYRYFLRSRPAEEIWTPVLIYVGTGGVSPLETIQTSLDEKTQRLVPFLFGASQEEPLKATG